MTAATTTKNVITHLSFTRLKELAHSPLALSRYIDKVFEPTAAMIDGQLIDCLLFTPDELENAIFVMPDGAKKPSKAPINAAKPSTAALDQMELWDRRMEAVKGSAIVDSEQVDESSVEENKV